MNVECALECGNPLNPHDEGTWKEVAGFVGGPHKDGMCLRKDTGRYAHNSCVQKAKVGQQPDQPEMFPDTPAHCGYCERPLPHNPVGQKACLQIRAAAKGW